jgi:uncharacterized protein (DUF433 family)
MDLQNQPAAVLPAQIVRDPERCGGAPSIAGTRVAVHDVVSHARHHGGDLERVRCEVLPHLSREQLDLAIAFYREHAEEIEAILTRQRTAYEQLPVAPRGR